jgi:CTP:molybdopterin cytidylyltransferase MocA
MTHSAPYAVILAAGTGTRFGGGKLLAPFRGRPIAAHVAQRVAEAIASGSLAGGVAVVPAATAPLAGIFDSAGLETVESAAAGSGLADSLRTGLAALESARQPLAGAAVVILADQPLVRGEVIAGLAARWRATGRSVRPRYARDPAAPGHPVVLDRSVWSLARGLTGDRGLLRTLRERPDLMDEMEVPGANPDVNTPADLALLEDG